MTKKKEKNNILFEHEIYYKKDANNGLFMHFMMFAIIAISFYFWIELEIYILVTYGTDAGSRYGTGTSTAEDRHCGEVNRALWTRWEAKSALKYRNKHKLYIKKYNTCK